MSKKLILVLVSFVFLFSFKTASAGVVINEIAWMGVEGNQYGEWIELHNEDSSSLDLSGWGLYESSGEVLIINLSKIIGANGYLLVERTTASSLDPVPQINDESGAFGGSGLSNSGEYLVLKDSSGNVVDSLDFSSGWTAGDANTKETMQKSGGSWITATATPKAVNATSGSTNDDGDDNSSSTSSTTTTTKTEETKTVGKLKLSVKTPNFVSIPVDFKIESTSTSCKKYFINYGDGDYEEIKKKVGEKFSHIYYYVGEYMVTLDCFKSYSKEDPEASVKLVVKIISSDISISKVGDEKDFFLEISNDTSHDADISNWFITGESNKFIFPKNTIIKSKGEVTLSPKITGFKYSDKNYLMLFNSESELIFSLLKTSPENIPTPKKSLSYNNFYLPSDKSQENTLDLKIKENLNRDTLENLEANPLKSTENINNNFKYGSIGFVLFIGFSAGLAYFVRNFGRKEKVVKEGDDFEIIDE